MSKEKLDIILINDECRRRHWALYLFKENEETRERTLAKPVEFEKVKELHSNHSWVRHGHNMAVKIVSSSLKYLPKSHEYKLVFMTRNMVEILRSQEVMLLNRRSCSETDLGRMRVAYEKHLLHIQKWIRVQDNITCLYVNYNLTLNNPTHHVNRVSLFIDQPLDTDKMLDIIDRNLYRNRV